MEQRLLGRSGLKVSALSLGTATFGGVGEWFRKWGTVDATEATRMVDLCRDHGMTLFDTSNNYSSGMAEELLGRALAGHRHQVLIGTKVNTRIGDGPNDTGSSRSHIVRACEDSLKRLGTDYIDLYQLHGFDAMTPVEEAVRALDDLVRTGKVRHIGCSNFSGWHLMKALAISERDGLARHVAHQVHYSLAAREFEWELMPLALAEGVGTTVWGPLSGAQLTGKVRRGQAAPSDSRIAAGAIFPIDQQQLFPIIDALDQVAGETGRTVSQVALRWVMQRPTVCSVVIGARNEAQLRENLAAAEFELEPDHMALLDTASARTPIYPYWHQRAADSERNPPPC